MNLKQVASISVLILSLGGPLYAWDNGQPATFVLGQPDFSSNTEGIDDKGMKWPYGIAVDTTTQRLFVAAIGNHRVMVFDVSGGLSNYMSAVAALGQPNLLEDRLNYGTDDPTITDDKGFNRPMGLWYDPSHKRLFASDSANHRVLVFDFQANPSLAPGRGADHVLGQLNFAATAHLPNRGGVPNGSSFDTPGSITFDPSPAGTSPTAQRLFVSDLGNHRVLVFNLTGGISDGMPSEYVLGQAVDTDFASNRGGAPDKNTMANPLGLHFDPTTHWLFVGDESNNRLLVFNLSALAGGLSNGKDAYRVLGQPNFSSNTPGLSDRLMHEASRGFYNADARELYVADESNNRVLVYDLTSGVITNGMPASRVMGQLNFTDNALESTQWVGNHFEDVFYDAGPPRRLYASDNQNNRVLIFEPPPPQCGGGLKICGTITSKESSIPLKGVAVELLDGEGKLLATKQTDVNGDYLIDTGLTAFNKYFIHPVIKRTQSAIPLQKPIPSLPSQGSRNDFQIRGWPGTYRLSDEPAMSLVLISTYNYTGSTSTQPPPTGPGISTSGLFSATVEINRNARVQVPQGSSYHLTCWVAGSSGGVTTFTRRPEIGSQALPPINPDDVIEVACP